MLVCEGGGEEGCVLGESVGPREVGNVFGGSKGNRGGEGGVGGGGGGFRRCVGGSEAERELGGEGGL